MQRPKNKEPEILLPIFCQSYTYKGPFQKIVEVAKYYGFTLIEPMNITKRLPAALSQARKAALKEKDFSDFPKDYMSTLKKYIDEKLHNYAQPIMLCHIIDNNTGFAELRLEIVGTKKSVAEATIISATRAILHELGFKNTYVRLNSVGDKESGSIFLRELTAYYREHIANLSPTLQQHIKKDILKIYSNTSEKYREINEGAPKPINFLTEEGRRHLSEVLDFLENLGISYEIGNELVGTSSCFPKTLYEILEEGKENSREGLKEVLARGERYNHLAQNIGFNKKLPIVGMTIPIKRKTKKKDQYVKSVGEQGPKIYFIHLGHDAKKKSLEILDTFRKSKVWVYQSLCNDSFANQLRMAEGAGVPFTMIMGQKEVLESSIIFRNMETRYQENIALSQLENFLKNLQKRKII